MQDYECKHCGKSFRNYISDKSKYCSKSCKDIGIQKFHTHSCQECNEPFVTKKSNSKFCSMSCSGKSASRKIVNRSGGAPSGKDHWNWKGGKNYSGMYDTVRTGGKYKYAHRLVVEQHMGRELLTNEQVHHINGNHKDNRIENLIVVTPSWHTKLHHMLRRQHG